MPKQFFDHQGTLVQLGDLIGKGGEGRVYNIVGCPDSVAKIYKHPVQVEKAAKLQLMVQLTAPDITQFAAWPQAIVYDRVGSGAIAWGVISRRIEQARPIHELYSSVDRRHHFPKADWQFLIRTARNCAHAFAILHSHGIIVGDVNQSNIWASLSAEVRFIDCDSFQVSFNGKVHLGPVGSPHFTPPELQLVDLQSVPRTPNHDAFGLAVLIFHLLFLGRHPFSGYIGAGDMPIEQAIREYRFAYGPNARQSQMEPPPETIGLQHLSKSVGQLFERAFSSKTRPAAQEWLKGLEEFESQLCKCSYDSAHLFHAQLSSCPWCAIRHVTGKEYFGYIPDYKPAARPTNTFAASSQSAPVVHPTTRPLVAAPRFLLWLLWVVGGLLVQKPRLALGLAAILASIIYFSPLKQSFNKLRSQESGSISERTASPSEPASSAGESDRDRSSRERASDDIESTGGTARRRHARPALSIVSYSPDTPCEGGTLSVTLGLRKNGILEFRQGANGNWEQMDTEQLVVNDLRPGELALEFRLRSSDGDVASESHTWHVNGRPTLNQVSLTYPDELIEGDTAHISCTGFDPDHDDLTYKYKISQEGRWQEEPNSRLNIGVIADGSLILSVKAADKYGNESDAVEKEWTVRRLPWRHLKSQPRSQRQTDIRAAALHPLGEYFATGGLQGHIVLQRLADQRSVSFQANDQKRVLAAAFSSDGQYLATGGAGGWINLWRPDSIKKSIAGGLAAPLRRLGPLPGETNYVRAICFTPSGNSLIAGSDDGIVRIWNLDSAGQSSITVKEAVRINAVSSSQNGDLIFAGCADGQLAICRRNQNRPQFYDMHTDEITDIGYSSNVNALATCSRNGSVMSMSLRTRTPTPVSKTSTGMRNVKFSNDGKLIAAFDKKGHFYVWRVTGEQLVDQQLGNGKSSEYSCACICPQDGTLVSCGYDEFLSVWRPE